jgi:hypothetical protein
MALPALGLESTWQADHSVNAFFVDRAGGRRNTPDAVNVTA